MSKLVDCVDVIVNNEECVILKIKDGKKIDLISMGYFNGDETMIRMTKDDDCNTYTIWKNDGTSFSWNNRTIKSEGLGKKQNKIAYCIQHDLGINMGKTMAFWDSIGSLAK